MSQINLKYDASVSNFININGLASSADLLSGRSSATIYNGMNYLDYIISGKITIGDSPIVGSIEVYLWSALNDTPLYPDGITGAKSLLTLTQETKDGLILVKRFITNTTSGNRYYFGPISLSSFFNGICPLQWGFWVTHNTGVRLGNANSDNVFSYTGLSAIVS